jgi:hypothetical protein
MTIQYTWTVTAMDSYPTEPQPDCVFNVHWNVTGTDNTYTSSVYSTCAIPYNSADPYIPYANLTQAEVLAWIYENGVNQTTTEEAVAQMIANQINPPVVTLPLPWAA